MTLRILVVEDEPTLLQNVTHYLQHQGYEAKGVADGAQALALLHEPWDLVLIDLMLPDQDGIDLLRTVKRARPQVAAVVMTGHSTVDAAVAAMKSGAADFLTKPFRLGHLREVVDGVIVGDRRPTAPAIAAEPRSPIRAMTTVEPPPVTHAAPPAQTRFLWKREQASIPAGFREEFSWLPDQALVVFSGLAEARPWQVAAQCLSLRLEEGHGIVYAAVEEPLQRLRTRLTPFFPEQALDEGVVALLDLSSLWVRIERQSGQVRVAGLEQVATVLMSSLDRRRLEFDRLTVMVDSLSAVNRMLDEREAFQFAHLLRSITREYNAGVLGTYCKDALTRPVQSEFEGLADVVISLERDPLRDIVRYEITKGSPSEQPRVNELRADGPFLVPVRPVSRKYGYARCSLCKQEFFVAFGSRQVAEGELFCQQCFARPA